MNPDADFETELVQSLPDGAGATDRARRAVERREKSVTGGVDLGATKPAQLLSYRGVVTQ